MQDLWYGDKRDRVKWGTLVTLAQDRRVQTIVWVAYYRKFKEKHLFFDNEKKDMPTEVWDHFSNMHNIQRLAKATSLEIDVFDQNFSSDIDRKTYQKNLLLHLDEQGLHRKIVFLDPDTGIVADKPTRKHVSVDEIRKVWDRLGKNDFLVVYQHAPHKKDWETNQRGLFEGACTNSLVQTVKGPEIAKDVAFFVASRKPN